MSESFDVVVVGAGAVGCACAYELVRAGLRTALVEQVAVASGSSTHATGYLSLAASDFRSEDHLRFGIESYDLTRDMMSELERTSGGNVLYQRRPFARLALDAQEEDLIKSQMAWQSKLIPLTWISGADVRRIEPRLTEAVRGAAYQDESAQLDSGRFTIALATAAERRGAVVMTRRVVGLLERGGAVRGVRFDSGELSAGAVVLAMGVWAPLASEWLGFQVPVKSLKGESLLLKLDGPPLPLLLSSPGRGHMISRADGLLSVGSTAGRDFDDEQRSTQDGVAALSFDTSATDAALDELLQRAIDVLPAAADAELHEQRAGVRPLSPDQLPLIGPVPGRPGVFLATGHGTKGIHLAAATGALITEMVRSGDGTSKRWGDVFSPSRFGGGSRYDKLSTVVDD